MILPYIKSLWKKGTYPSNEIAGVEYDSTSESEDEEVWLNLCKGSLMSAQR